MGNSLRRLLFLIVLFIVVFFAIFTSISIIYFVNSASYNNGVVFSYPNSVFVYSLKVSVTGSLIISVGLWLFIVCGVKR